MLALGDPHNFGRRVHRIERASGGYFQKPRSVFWERLFFGLDSPLRAALLEPSDGAPEVSLKGLVQCLFGLAVESDDPSRGGVAREVLSEENRLERTEELRRFGGLIGYAFALGIRDLHAGNLIATRRGLQVVDAEVVLADLTLPHETLLLPFKGVSFARSGIGILYDDHSQITLPDAIYVLRGFSEMLRLLRVKSAKMLSVIRDELDQARQVPVRHIMRDTTVYREWANGIVPDDWLSVESEQISRGDIPYFFKHVGSHALYRFVDREGGFERVELPEAKLRAVRREAVDPAILLDPDRLTSCVFGSGSLYLCRHLVPADFFGEIEVSHELFVELSRTSIKVRSGLGTFEASRFRRLP